MKLITFLLAILTILPMSADSLKFIISRNKYLIQGEKLSLDQLQGKIIIIGSAHST